MIVIFVILSCILTVVCIYKEKKLREQKITNTNYKKGMAKFQEYFELLDQWMMNREQGMSVENYFVKNGYENIAIYGMGPLGNHLYEELVGSDKVHVAYTIDKKGQSVFPELSVKTPTEELPEVDAVIITVTIAYGNIAVMLEEKMNASMISLEEVICES